MSIASIAKEAGHDVDLILTDEHRNFLDMIAQYKPDLIAFSFMTGNRRWAFSIAKEIKAKMATPIIFGGVHTTLFPEDIDFSYVDFICIGEGEYPVLELLNALDKGDDYSKIQNLWLKKRDEIIKNPMRNLIQDFDALPLPYREIYYKYKFIRDLPIKRFISGIGCPYMCTFCHNPMQAEHSQGKGNFVRKKSVKRIICEIKEVKDNYILKRVHFSDDLFVLNKKWLKEFLEAYREEIDLPFSCNIRIDRVDEEMVRDMYESKCWGVSFGIESGSDRIRNGILKKNLKEEAIIKNSKLLKKYGIKLITSNMVGLPEETIEEAFQTIRLNQKIRADYVRSAILIPYPKTGVVNYAISKGLLPADYTIDRFEQIMRDMRIKSSDKTKFENLCSLFSLTVKFPILTPITRQLIKIPCTPLFSCLRLWEGVENFFYHQMFNLSGFRYAYHILKKSILHLWR